MLPLTSAVLLGALIAFTIESASSLPPYAVNGNVSCEPYQTACEFGCCPYADAVCCSDGFECCQHGQTCIPYVGLCVGGEDRKREKAALVYRKDEPVLNVVPPCPSGTTTCAPGKCCRYPEATCCSDNEHCCPNGYSCDLAHQKCVKYSDNALQSLETPIRDKPMLLKKVVLTAAVKSCPGGSRQCPSHTSCCLTDGGDWGCCPKPSSKVFHKGNDNECCETITGYICCPDVAPHCTVWGCTP